MTKLRTSGDYMDKSSHRTLVVGDLHTKLPILEKVIAKANDYDKIIFLGDYVDEWGTSAIFSANLLARLIEFKKTNMDKVVLILGNHCLSEWQGGIFRCSGYSETTHEAVYTLYQDNEELFRIAYAQDGILFTHAGLTKSWCKDNKIDINLSAQEYANILNLAMTERYESQYKTLFRALASAGPERGGIHSPSPLWADELELRKDAVEINQVVGHTPERHILIIDNDNYHLAFCDTFSLYPDYSPIGDNHLLEINNKEWKDTPL